MSVSRRSLLLGASAIALLATTSACTSEVTNEASVERVISTHFGADIAQSDPARRFAVAFVTHMATQPGCSNPWIACADPEARIVQSFLESTTYLAAKAGVAEFDFVTIYHPAAASCASQLVAPINA